MFKNFGGPGSGRYPAGSGDNSRTEAYKKAIATGDKADLAKYHEKLLGKSTGAMLPDDVIKKPVEHQAEIKNVKVSGDVNIINGKSYKVGAGYDGAKVKITGGKTGTIIKTYENSKGNLSFDVQHDKSSGGHISRYQPLDVRQLSEFKNFGGPGSGRHKEGDHVTIKSLANKGKTGIIRHVEKGSNKIKDTPILFSMMIIKHAMQNIGIMN